MSFMWERTGRTWRFHFLTSYVYTVSPSFSVELRVRHHDTRPDYYNLGKFASLKEAKQAVMTDAEKRVPEAFKHYMADGGPLVRRANPGNPPPELAEAIDGYEDACAQRLNPGDPHNPAVAEATAGYEDFHAFSPREVGQLRGLIIPRTICLAGEAVQTLYRSDKWENKKNDYYHDHDPGVKVGRTDEHGQMVAVPAEIAGWSSDDPRDLGLYKLGDCLGFFYRDLDGEEIEAHVSRPLPELYATASRKVLLVIEVSGDAAEVQAILWGGKLCVKDVGIVG